jgi:hypothetical protein
MVNTVGCVIGGEAVSQLVAAVVLTVGRGLSMSRGLTIDGLLGLAVGRRRWIGRGGLGLAVGRGMIGWDESLDRLGVLGLNTSDQSDYSEFRHYSSSFIKFVTSQPDYLRK